MFVLFNVRNHKVKSIFFWVLSYLVLGVIICILFLRVCTSPQEWISVIGTYSSVFSLLVVLIQFQSVKATAEKTQEEINRISSITEWSRYAEMANSLKEDIRLEDYSVVAYKLHHIKQALICMPDSLFYINPDLKDTKNKCVRSINTFISSIDSFSLDSTSYVPKVEMMKEIEEASDLFKTLINNKIS